MNFCDLTSFRQYSVIHAYAKAGGHTAASKAQELLALMHKKHAEGNTMVKPDTITYNIIINALAKSGGKGAAAAAENLLAKMHQYQNQGDPDIRPNVVTYGAVVDAYAKSGEKGAAARADTLLANMIQMFQQDPKYYKSPMEKNDHQETDMSGLKGIDQSITMIGQQQRFVALGGFDIRVHTMTISTF